MKTLAFVVAFAALFASRAAAAFEPCETPVPAPLPRGVHLLMPPDQAAAVPTNAAIVFSPLGGAIADVLVTASAGGSPRAGSLETIGLLQIFHLSSSLAPTAQYHLAFRDEGQSPPQIVSTSGFATGSAGDSLPPSMSGLPQVAIGPYCSILDSYPLDVTWPAATDPDESVLAYSVTLVAGSSLTGIAATTALAASFSAGRGTQFEVSVQAFDRTGASAAPIVSQQVFVPAGTDAASSGGCRCDVDGSKTSLAGSLVALCLGVLAIRVTRRS